MTDPFDQGPGPCNPAPALSGPDGPAPAPAPRACSDDIAERYCSSCAWPYECAEAQACHRRETGEVRSPYPGSDGSASPFANGMGFIGAVRVIGVDLASEPDRTAILPLRSSGTFEAKLSEEAVAEFWRNFNGGVHQAGAIFERARDRRKP